MTAFKTYIYSPYYQLPYQRLESFLTKIEYPSPSENRAISHLRQNSPKGFWNNGVLGELMERLNPSRFTLPTSPLGNSAEKLVQKNKMITHCDLYIVMTFYEGLDSADFFINLLKEINTDLQPSKIFIAFDYVPLSLKTTHIPGVELLTVELTKFFNFHFFDVHSLDSRIFSKNDSFIHLHNKIFNYYSHFEVLAKMNGANVLYAHPKKELSFETHPLENFSFLTKETALELHHLQLIHTLAKDLCFEVKG